MNTQPKIVITQMISVEVRARLVAIGMVDGEEAEGRVWTPEELQQRVPGYDEKEPAASRCGFNPSGQAGCFQA
jgi:hypothetical protein